MHRAQRGLIMYYLDFLKRGETKKAAFDMETLPDHTTMRMKLTCQGKAPAISHELFDKLAQT